METVSEIKVKEIISYGAGNFSTSPIARYQFAFLILFAEHLQVGQNYQLPFKTNILLIVICLLLCLNFHSKYI